jgi:hypothetical protein
MAGAAAKKTARNAEVKSKYYFGIALGASVINFVIQIGLFERSMWTLVQSGFLAVMAWLSYRMIFSALELGVGYDLWQDLFVINTVVQLGSLGSKYVWVTYLLVPGYGVYQLGGKVLAWVFTPKESERSNAPSSSSKQRKARY